VTNPGIERTLVLVKPDGVARGLSGEVIRRIEA
jgi:nucleoside-diphosphate kinase